MTVAKLDELLGLSEEPFEATVLRKGVKPLLHMPKSQLVDDESNDDA